MPPAVALATSRSHAAFDADAPALLDALDRLGVGAEMVAWDDPDARWENFSLVVVRSTWDYVERRDEFVAWATGVPRLANPASVVAWNTDKSYLGQLHEAGVPIIATDFLDPGQPLSAPGDDFVVKPSVGAGASDTARYGADPAALVRAQAHVEAIGHSGRRAMVQPYVASVETLGETALVFLGGHYSHSVRKGAMLAGPDVLRPEDQHIEPVEANADQRDLAAQVLAVTETLLPAADPLLYARVDLVTDAQGRPQLMELEVTEPFLFLSSSPGAVDRFAAAIGARLG